MTTQQITERIQKANEKIEKKQGTIAKKQALLAKKQDGVEMMKANPDKYTSDNIYWTECDIRHLTEDIARLEKEIPEIRKTVEKYEKQLAGEIEKEALLTREMPEEFRTLKDELVNRWDKFDIERKARLEKAYKELGYYEFCQKYEGAGYELIHTTEEDLHKKNNRDAEYFIIDLYNRVKDITGQVTNWEGIHLTFGNSFPVLEGTVQGKEGKARVETVEAGGWNIQRLHIRTLVHSI